MLEKGERRGDGGDQKSPSHGARVKPSLKELGFSYSRASR
jgi:hypothetical protein